MSSITTFNKMHIVREFTIIRVFVVFMSLFISQLHAQTNGLLYFTVTDAAGEKILPSHAWKVSASIKDAADLPVAFITADTAYIIVLPQESYNTVIEIQLTYTAGNYTGIMNVYARIAGANANGACHTCAITDMQYHPGNFMLDLPYQQESWDFLNTMPYTFENADYSLKNISMLQNWNTPNLK